MERFFIEFPKGTKAHLIMYLSRYSNVNMNISVESPTFICKNADLNNRINRKTGKLYHTQKDEYGQFSPYAIFPYAIPEIYRNEICDALNEMKELSKRLKTKESIQ